MNIPLNFDKILREYVHFVWLYALFYTVHFTSIGYILEVLLLIYSRDITRVKDIIDIFEHLFIYYLGIYKEEG